jgi:drug/metabolite transporter (DMT)-like permease
MMFVGMLTAGPLALMAGPMPEIKPEILPWLAASAGGGVLGILFCYKGYRLGKVGVVAALTSTEGAIAAVLSVVAGERLTPAVAFVLLALAAGVAFVALTAGDQGNHEHTPEQARREREGALYGALAALVFGLSIYGTAQLGKSLTPFAAVLPVRVAGTLVVFLPLLATGRLNLTRRTLPMVVVIGTFEVFGNALFVVGTGESIAITAVLASQFAAITAIAAFMVFKERLTSKQGSGVVAIAICVAALTLVRSL